MSGSRQPRYWLVEQLPRPMADDPFLRSFSLIFEDLADGVRDPVLSFEHFLDIDLAPSEFVRWMASWIGLSIDASVPEERQRKVLRAAGILFPWRGTRVGLEGLIATLVESRVEVVDHGGVYGDDTVRAYDPRVTVHIENPGGMDENQLRRLIQSELPANAELELVVGKSTVEQKPASPETPGGGEGKNDGDQVS